MTTTNVRKAVLPCTACGKLNRVDLSRAEAQPKCGTCRVPLVLDAPVVLTDANFDTVVGNSTVPVMVDFYADWCVACKEMERFTFSDPQVADTMGRFEMLQVDVTANNADDRALMKAYSLFGPPAILLFDNNGNAATPARVIGFTPAPEFLAALNPLLL